MGGHGNGIGYSIGKIFWALFILTMVEVAWGMWLREPRWFLWTGLLTCAAAKGLLIFMYFMHMKFEKWIVWSLIVPTPLLIGVVLFALMPDLAFNDQRDHPNGDMLDQHGNIVRMIDIGAAGVESGAAGH